MKWDELKEIMETSFVARFENHVYQLIKLKFPNIKELEVYMDEHDDMVVLYNEFDGSPTSEEVHNYIEQSKKEFARVPKNPPTNQ